MRRRVVVTGLGVACGLGTDPDAFWEGLDAGRSCIRSWSDKDPRIASRYGAAFDLPLSAPEPFREPLRRLLRAAGPWSALTAHAAVQAQVDAGEPGDPERCAHVCAGQNLSLGYYADNLAAFREHPDDVEPLLGMIALDTDTVGLVAELLGVRGPTVLIGGACASGNLAVLHALDLIRSGRADRVVVTGAPFPSHPMILHALTVIEAIAFRSFVDAPHRASRPFDALREGFVPAESAGAVVLEAAEVAEARGARIGAEILGAASTGDACRLPKPHVEGQVRAIRLALADARRRPEDVDYVNAHATSTPLGDAVEVAALKEALGKRAWDIPINATKSMIGHGITSAAILELVATVLQIRHGRVHPTINQEHPDPSLGLDFVPNRSRAHRIDLALSNSFGFGGINSCIAVGRT